MVDILINLAEDIKLCLLGSLGIGVVTGYLFTKLRVSEKYIPTIYKLEDTLQNKESAINANEVKKHESIKLAKNLNEKLNKTNQEVSKLKDITNNLETQTAKSKSEQESLKNQYSKQENILNDYDKEIINLNYTLGLSGNIKPAEKKEMLKAEIETNEQEYIKECDRHFTLENQSKELEKKTLNLTSNLNTLTTSWNEKNKELSETTNAISALKEKLQKQYEQIQLEKQESDEKIDSFKKQLLDIKSKLS